KTYFDWMRNIEPWCVSRQLWWGHRIPAWHGPDGRIFVAETEAEARDAATEHYGREESLRQDDDVLDTWFSSALWPFSTLGWPEKTPDLQRFYPTDTLVTGFDIIFFWVARMMMMSLHFMGEVPFRRVVINALVRDAEGAKMSKSKGNVMDPLELIDAHGADALRFTLTAMSGQGRDIRLSTARIEGYRNFVTKLWNAARFCEVNGCARQAGFDPGAAKLAINRWILGETSDAMRAATAALEACAFDDAAGRLYRFVWNVYCDWYLELAKPVLADAAGEGPAETRAMAAWVLDTILTLLHPIMPFVTEALWDETGGGGLLIAAAWPRPKPEWEDSEAAIEIGWLIALVTEIRQLRAEINAPPAARPRLSLIGANDTTAARLRDHLPLILRLARLQTVDLAVLPPPGALAFVIGEATGALVVAELIDIGGERARLSREIAARQSDLDKVARKLGNADFVARAPAAVVEENRQRLAEVEGALARLRASAARLEAIA
ncbi:MAG: class I tRNA ligase family protein, partial [Caulobacteraceae bacterium]